MDFNQDQNPDSDWTRLKRNILIATVIFFAVVSLTYFFNNQDLLEKAPDESELQHEVNRIETQDYEIEHHVTQFLSKMFSFDQNNFKQNVESSLALIDEEEGNLLATNYENIGVEKLLLKDDLVHTVVIDSMRTKSKSYPFAALVFAKVNVESKGQKVQYSLICRMNLVNTPRTINNPNGLLINNFEVLESDLLAK